MKADTICCYWISKRMTKEALQNHCMHQITRARLTACEVGVFSREISPKYAHPLLLGATEVHCPWVYFREITVL